MNDLIPNELGHFNSHEEVEQAWEDPFEVQGDPEDDYDYDDDLDPEDDLDLDDLDYGDNIEWFEGFAQGYAAGLYHNSLRARLGRARWRFLKRMPHKIRWCFWHIVYRLFPDDRRIPF